jgi:hypothetical protein
VNVQIFDDWVICCFIELKRGKLWLRPECPALMDGHPAFSSIPVPLVIDKGSGCPLFHSREGGNPVNEMILEGKMLLSTAYF